MSLFRKRRTPSAIQPEPIVVYGDPVPAVDSTQYTPLSHKVTQIQALHDKGYRGATRKGVPCPIFLIDTGGDPAHEDLRRGWGRWAKRIDAKRKGKKRGFCARRRPVVTGGYDLTGRARGAQATSRWADKRGHGTHVAGIAGARDNSAGIIGIAPDADIWAMNVFARDKYGRWVCYDEWIVAAIDEAIAIIDRDYRPYGMPGGILNASLGTKSPMKPIVQKALDRARKAGLAVVCAAGNDGDACNYPAAYDSCLAVGALDRAQKVAEWSSHGTEVDVAATATKILSCAPGGKYVWLSGTSMASPVIAGFGAIILAQMAPQIMRGTAIFNTYVLRKHLRECSDRISEVPYEGEEGWRIIRSERMANALTNTTMRTLAGSEKATHTVGRDIELMLGDGDKQWGAASDQMPRLG